MPWNDDSWKDGYDAWKLAAPDDDYEDEDPCDHEDYDVDILEGRARCSMCGESWYCSDEEVLRQIDHEAAYAAWEEGENRRQWWRDRWDSVKSFFRRRQRGPTLVSDDDIPF